MNGYTQWRVFGGSLVPEGPVVLLPRVKKGEYEITPQGPGKPLMLTKIRPVQDQLVRVKDTVSDQIMLELSQFWSLRGKYNGFGMAHKRGVLLYGPPGSGKTSTIRQLIDDVVDNQDAVVVHALHASWAVQVLRNLREVEPDRKVLVIMEDVDDMVDREEQSVLELLDGKDQIDGVVYVATTNYLKRLPSRIRNRPSRFDRVIKIDKPSAELRREYIKSRNAVSVHELEKYVTDTDGLSIAHVKELIIGVHAQGLRYDEVLKRIKDMATLAEKEDAENNGE